MSNVCPLGGLPLPVHPREKNAYLLKLVIRIKTVIPKPPLFLGETICGISSTYFREDGSASCKERHRFRFTVEASTTSVSINLKASFQALVCRCLVMVILVQGTDRCVLVFVTGAEASGIGRCRCLLPGDYTLCCKHIRVLHVNTDII